MPPQISDQQLQAMFAMTIMPYMRAMETDQLQKVRAFLLDEIDKELERRNDAPASIIGHTPPPSDDFTGPCPCGCGAQFKRGKEVFER